MRLAGLNLRALLLLLLAVIGAASWWWLQQQQKTPAQETVRHPDAYFRGLDIVQHAPNGDPETRVRAVYAEHFADESWIHLRELDAEGLAAGPDWRLTAEHGRLTDDGVELQAWDNVVLTRKDSGASMRLRTERLDVNTETQIAATDETVRIEHGDNVITGRGFRASLADDRLVLESNVEARYAN